jgi:PAS domain-containing protein
MFVAWGPDLTFYYNAAYAPILGPRHPDAHGQPFRLVWPEVWDELLPLIRRALDGEATWSENLHLVLHRHGYPEDAWYTFSVVPRRVV